MPYVTSMERMAIERDFNLGGQHSPCVLIPEPPPNINFLSWTALNRRNPKNDDQRPRHS